MLGTTMSDDNALEICRLQEKLKSDRGNWETTWQSVAERVLPNYSDFTTEWAPGQRRTNRIFDSTAPIALEHGCAALESMACPGNSIWHRLRPRDPSLRNDISIAQYCDQVNDCLFRARYAPAANFQGQAGEAMKQIMAFGNGPVLVDDVVGYGLRYRTLHLSETFGIENSAGIIDHIHWVREWTASACVDALNRGMFDSLPKEISEAADSTPTRKFKFIQAIYPNKDRDPKAKDAKGMAFESVIVSCDFKVIVKQGGYRTQPILFPRYSVAPKETYGRGPGINVLPDILMLNEMRKIQIRQGQRIIEPPLVAADDSVQAAFSMRGNSINYGWLNPQTGKPMIAPLEVGGNYEVSKDMLEEARQIVRTAFLNGVFSILDQHPEMTATEVLERAQEQGYLVSPIVGRIQTEWFGPQIERELDILDRAGQLPPPPDKLKKMGGIEFDVVYESAIQINQRKSKALAIASVLQQAAPLIETDKTGKVLSAINPLRTLRCIVDSNGAPADMLSTDDEMAAQDQAAADQNQLQAIATTAGPASEAIKNLAQAKQAGMSVTPGSA